MAAEPGRDGRPKRAEKRIGVHVRIGAELLRRLDSRARSAGVSRSEALRLAVLERCDRRDALDRRRCRLENGGWK